MAKEAGESHVHILATATASNAQPCSNGDSTNDQLIQMSGSCLWMKVCAGQEWSVDNRLNKTRNRRLDKSAIFEEITTYA